MTGFYYVTNQVFEIVVDSSISIISLYPIPSVQEIADNYKKPPYWTVITLLKIKDIVQILSHSRMGEDLCFEVGIRNLIVNRHSNQVNQLL